MIKTVLLFFFTLFLLSFDAEAKRCSRFACLEFSNYGDKGWKVVKIKNQTSKTLACFIRYENSIFVEQVKSSSSPYYLRPHYPASLVSYRCDVKDQGCHPLLVSKGLCKNT